MFISKFSSVCVRKIKVIMEYYANFDRRLCYSFSRKETTVAGTLLIPSVLNICNEFWVIIDNIDCFTQIFIKMLLSPSQHGPSYARISFVLFNLPTGILP